MSSCRSVCVWDFSIRLFLVLLPLGVQVGGPVSLLGCPEKRCTFHDCDGTIKSRFCLLLGFAAQSSCASAIIVFLLDSLANPHRSLKLPSSHCNTSVGITSILASCIFITPAFLLVFIVAILIPNTLDVKVGQKDMDFVPSGRFEALQDLGKMEPWRLVTVSVVGGQFPD